jgi:hypothetical protein
MWSCNRKLKICVRILSIVILLSFLKFPMYAEPLTEQETNLTERGTRLYSDLEVDILIDDISQAAYEAIEQAASEGARAAAIEALEREAALVRQSNYWRNEADIQRQATNEAKKAGRKNTLIGVLLGILGGLAAGVTGTLIIGGR